MRVISQAAMRQHVLQLPDVALAAKFAPFAAKVLAWADVEATAPSRERARAIVGWMSAHAIHPQDLLHPNGTTLNLDALPPGETWASFNVLFNAPATVDRDQAYWYALFPNGISMLQKLIGTVAANGGVSDDGMLTEYEPGKWRIRDFASFRAPQCTLQCKMAQVLLAAIGIPSVDISTVGHDPMAFYDIEAARWSYIDPTFGEMLTVLDEDLTALDLISLSLAGETGTITSSKLPGADYIPLGYFTSPNTPAGGMSSMTVHTAPQWAGGLSSRAPYRFGDLPGQGSTEELSGTASQIMPTLGLGIAGIEQAGLEIEVRPRSNWPGHVDFQHSSDGGATWEPCSTIDYFAVESSEIRYRSIDANGFAGTIAIVSA